MKPSDRLVVPGERLGVIEEFIPGPGTYVEGGTIYSQVVGKLTLDNVRKEVSVRPMPRGAATPSRGSYIIGEVAQVTDKVAFIKAFKVNGRNLAKPFTLVLHISMVTRYLAKPLHELFKPGDIIAARVIGDQNYPYQVSTAERGLGTILAFCSKCGSKLERLGAKLKCPSCGSIETRKLSERYGALEV